MTLGDDEWVIVAVPPAVAASLLPGLVTPKHSRAIVNAHFRLDYAAPASDFLGLVGATAHYINNDLDEGPIIAQGVEVVDHSHYPQDLIAKGRDIEAQTLARGVGYHIERRVFLNGGRTVVL